MRERPSLRPISPPRSRSPASGSWWSDVTCDGPPVHPMTAALVAARSADAVLVVASQGQTSRRAFQRAVEMLQQIDAPLLTPILNRATDEVRAYSGAYEADRPAERKKAPSK